MPGISPLSLSEGYVAEAIKVYMGVTPALDSVIVDAGDAFVIVMSVEVSDITKSRSFPETKPFVEKLG